MITKKIKNTDLFNYCLFKDTEFIDEDYHVHVEEGVIPGISGKSSHDFRYLNIEVTKLVDKLDELLNVKHIDISNECCIDIIKKLIDILSQPSGNYLPLAQYLPVHNISCSMIESKDIKLEDKINFMMYIMPYYIKDRHYVYKNLGYSEIVMQVLCDCYSHKRKGEYGIYKIKKMMSKLSIPMLPFDSYEFKQSKDFYMLPDSVGKKQFIEFSKIFNVSVSSKKNKTPKYPDGLVKISTEYFIIEHKQIKETGGGQDKQVLELIQFISQVNANPHIHYVGLLDGAYYNSFKNSLKTKRNKIYKQLIDITTNLTKYRRNYFMDSDLFVEFLKYYNVECKYNELNAFLDKMR